MRGSSSHDWLGMSVVRHCIPSICQFGQTDYGTSEIEVFVRKKADEPVGASVCVSSAEGLSSDFRTEAQPRFGTGWTKYDLGDSA